MTQDISSGELGLGVLAMAAHNGLRVTADSAYLSDKPPNLTIKTESPVARILFSGKTAIGVELISGTQCWFTPLRPPRFFMATAANDESQILRLGKPS